MLQRGAVMQLEATRVALSLVVCIVPSPAAGRVIFNYTVFKALSSFMLLMTVYLGDIFPVEFAVMLCMLFAFEAFWMHERRNQKAFAFGLAV